MKNSETVEKFLSTLENRSDFEELVPYYHPDIEQVEFPNALTGGKTVRNLDDLKLAAENGKQTLSDERYEIVNQFAFESTVIVEAVWTGTLAVPIGKLQAGNQVKAYFAQFYEFKNGRIIKQRNYDCFEPLG